jgi:hypothetical protein
MYHKSLYSAVRPRNIDWLLSPWKLQHIIIWLFMSIVSYRQLQTGLYIHLLLIRQYKWAPVVYHSLKFQFKFADWGLQSIWSLVVNICTIRFNKNYAILHTVYYTFTLNMINKRARNNFPIRHSVTGVSKGSTLYLLSYGMYALYANRTLVSVKYVLVKVATGHSFLRVFRFTLSVLFYQCSILTLILLFNSYQKIKLAKTMFFWIPGNTVLYRVTNLVYSCSHEIFLYYYFYCCFCCCINVYFIYISVWMSPT